MDGNIDGSVDPEVLTRWIYGFSFGLLTSLASVLVKEHGAGTFLVQAESAAAGAAEEVLKAVPAAPSPAPSLPSPTSLVHLFDNLPLHQVVIYVGMGLALATCGIFYFYIRYLSSKRERKAGFFGNMNLPLVASGLVILAGAYSVWGQDLLGLGDDDLEGGGSSGGDAEGTFDAVLQTLSENPTVVYTTMGTTVGALLLYLMMAGGGGGGGHRHHRGHRKKGGGRAR